MADAHVEEHSSQITTPRLLIVVVVLAFLVPVLGIINVAKMVAGGMRTDPTSTAMSESEVAQRLRPVGELVIAQSNGAAGSRGGEEVYDAACVACHGAGVLGAPKLGDANAWTSRLAQGKKTLVHNAINGIRQMLPRGGNPSLTDAEVERAVVFMGNKSGGSL